ncbi:MAG: ATP synthase F1 subunit gamma [Desulfurellaceae bacterium]|jgi:F-type H+-transporting ATPase subunit gamma|nr:ATP synthase F1 subunit gamma [Desulfurellaceae bacterium]
MATTRDIKRKISTIVKTQQITRAMKMVAAAKLRRIQETTLHLRFYSTKIEELMTGLLKGASLAFHPLFRYGDVKNVELIIITADRGLCGSFNHNVLKKAEDMIKNFNKEGKTVSLTVIGRHGYNYLKFRGYSFRKTYMNILSKEAKFTDAMEIMDDVMNIFLEEKLDEVYLIYNRFVNTLVQKVTVKQVFPLSLEKTEREVVAQHIFEPSMEEVLESLLPRYVYILLYSAMLESLASEHAARMTAMDNATKNADDMVRMLVLSFNNARQIAITRELIEITTSVEAMKY